MGRLEPEPKREPLQPNVKLFPVGDPAINNTLSRINGDLFNTSCKAYNILPSFNPGVQDLINRYYINTYSDTLAWNAFVEGSMFVYMVLNEQAKQTKEQLPIFTKNEDHNDAYDAFEREKQQVSIFAQKHDVN